MSCRDSDTLIKDEWFLFVLSSQGFAAICSAVISLFAIKKCVILHFHVNCRVSHVVRFILYDSCEATISSALCFALRLPAGICVASFAVLQLGMVMERAIALRRRQHYETSGATLGYVTAGSCIIPYYTLASPLLLLLLLKWSSHKRIAKLAALPKTANEQTYFDAYAKMWAVTIPSKH
ncbi:unnamed protein product [Cylicocyclus nassatus]|uniref:Uncharacterized protein n=1 Tax=Cylicocyclus nassatus TaxID=53992 RepID=A0AA36HAY8_CYLNA|nr:unnamed protein product [Cylicocyclus nassatus]